MDQMSLNSCIILLFGFVKECEIAIHSGDHEEMLSVLVKKMREIDMVQNVIVKNLGDLFLTERELDDQI